MDTRQSQNYLRFLDSAEQRVVCITLGKGNPNKKLISESGLYKLVLRSDKPEAKPFQDWGTKVVLPAIRKDGGHVLGEEKVVTGDEDHHPRRPRQERRGVRQQPRRCCLLREEPLRRAGEHHHPVDRWGP